MSNFEEIKARLKDQWLDYYEINQYWIIKLACWVECVQSRSKRPNAKVILTAVSLLEPAIIDFLIPLVDIDSDGERVVKTLGLDFDPRDELKEREERRSKIQEAEIIPLLPESTIDPDTEYLNQFRNQN
ncbi:DUF5331 domain-containing protein [Pannus brasiliensis CCIBt3594]|uniref:DUF5331 domain-containing protein n=1 Tax=Pannus brasiliensis CCIBt3594 TaxID=1427578 RepID=A0AAW9QYS9_9CHRO